MTIGIDARLWNETGVGRYIRNLITELDNSEQQNPSDFTYIIFLKTTEYKSLQFKSKNIVKREADVHWHSLKEQIHFLRIINKENLDLMHFPYFSVPYLYKRPFVLTIHDLIINHFPTGRASTLRPSIYKVKRKAYEVNLQHAARSAVKIIAPSTATKNDVVKTLKILPDKIIVTREGVDERIIHPTSRDAVSPSIKKAFSSDYFLYVGNAYPHKNLENLLKAFSGMKKRNPVQLILVGREDYFYKNLEIPEHVIILHDVNDSELSQLYHHAKALVAPSMIEGFGLPVLEAMAVGSLVVASNIPPFVEICKDNAIYFNPKNISSITNSLEKVYDMSHQQKESFIKRGKEMSKEYSWKKMTEETLSVYKNCLKKD